MAEDNPPTTKADSDMRPLYQAALVLLIVAAFGIAAWAMLQGGATIGAPTPEESAEVVPDTTDMRALRQRAESGDPSAQLDLGLAYHNGEGVRQDDAEAVRWWRMAAEQGYAQAQFNLGNAYAQWRGRAAG